MMRNNNRAFTIIELIVVIAVIAVLATVVLVSVNQYTAKARDARRKQDLTNIAKALVMYYGVNGNWISTGSGCGSAGNGNGWFNYANGGSYPKSTAQCLVDAGFTATAIIDPTGGVSSTPTSGFAYMKYHCGTPSAAYVYAKLETLPQSSTALDGTCCTTCDSSYGMNYYVKVQ